MRTWGCLGRSSGGHETGGLALARQSGAAQAAPARRQPKAAAPAASRAGVMGESYTSCPSCRQDEKRAPWRRPGPSAMLARRGGARPLGARHRRGEAGGTRDRPRARAPRHARRGALPPLGGGGSRHGRGPRRPRRRGRGARGGSCGRPRGGRARGRGRAPFGRRRGARQQRLHVRAHALRRARRGGVGREPRHESPGAVPPRLAPRPRDAPPRRGAHHQPGGLGRRSSLRGLPPVLRGEGGHRRAHQGARQGARPRRAGERRRARAGPAAGGRGRARARGDPPRDAPRAHRPPRGRRLHDRRRLPRRRRATRCLMAGYLARRLLRAATTLLGTTLILFVLVRVVPADPAVSIAGPKALGLDDPLPVQYGRYLWALVHGDLGRSYVTGRGVAALIGERLPATALLAVTSLAIGFALGVGVGLLTAARQGSAADLGVLLATLVGLSIPTFFVGNLLIYLFGYRLRWLPLGGYGGVRHLLLPAATLAFVELLFYARFVHTSVSGTLASDYVRTARAKGVRPLALYLRHALRNALVPIVTLLGLDVASLMSGVVLTETVFNWPGLGRLAVQAVFSLDIPLVAGTVLFSAVLVLACNLAVDLLYGVIDPRVQHG